jgi:hypothetical protein
MPKKLTSLQLLKLERKKLDAKIKNGFWISQTYYRNRDINLISARLQWAYAIQRKVCQGPHKAWWDKASVVGCYWGKVKNMQGKWETQVTTCSDDGYNDKFLSFSDWEYQARVANDKDLPLMLVDADWEPAHEFITKRLEGTLEPIPRRQDLTDEREHLDIRKAHCWKVIGMYQEILTRYVTNKYHDQVYTKYREKVIMVIDIGSARYHFNGTGSSFELFRGNVHYFTEPKL